MKPIDFKRLWSVVIDQFPMGIHSIHGPIHWKQVEKNGLLLAKETGADETTVTLFSIFHDCRRENENIDDGHGIRGSELAISMRGTYFDLPDHSFEILIEACRYHTDGKNCAQFNHRHLLGCRQIGFAEGWDNTGSG